MTPKLGAVIEECGRHVRYMNYARSRLPRPVTEAHFADSRDEFIAALDQFAFRFIRLQDALGWGALRLVLASRCSASQWKMRRFAMSSTGWKSSA